APDRLGVGEVELMGVLVGLEGLVVLAQRAGDAAQHVLHGVLLATLLLGALLDQEVGERLGLGPFLAVDVLGDQGQRGVLVVPVALQRKLVGLDSGFVL